MGRGKKPFKKRTKAEQERTRNGLYRHFTEISNHAKKVLKDNAPKNESNGK